MSKMSLNGLPPPPLAVLRGHNDSVISVKFLKNILLFSGAANGKLRLWNLRNMRTDVHIAAHDSSILSINTDLESRVITQSRDGTIKLWDTHTLHESSQPMRILRTGFDHFCNASAYATTESQMLISPGVDQSEIILWDTRASQPVAMRFTPAGASGMVTSLRLFASPAWPTDAATESPSATTGILAGYEDGTLLGLDLRNVNSPLFSQKLHSEPIFALDVHVSKKGTQVMTGGGDAVLQRSTLIRDSDSVKATPSEKINLPYAGTGCVKYRSDGRIIVSTHWDGTVRVFDQKRLKPLAILRHHRDSAYAVDFAPLSDAAASVIPAASECSVVPSSGSGDDGGHERSQTCAGLTDVLLDTTPGTSQDESTTNTIQASGVFTDFDSMVGRNFPEGVFATGSKDHTIAIWDLFADSFTL